jgi:hypothetical protein
MQRFFFERQQYIYTYVTPAQAPSTYGKTGGTRDTSDCVQTTFVALLPGSDKKLRRVTRLLNVQKQGVVYSNHNVPVRTVGYHLILYSHALARNESTRTRST